MFAALLVVLALFVVVKVMAQFGCKILGCLLILFAFLAILGSCSSALLDFH